MGIVAIVDDHALDRALLKRSVKKDRNFSSVLELESEKECLKYLSTLLSKKPSELPVLFIVDLRMEKDDSGYRILQHIRDTVQVRHIPVVICSSSNRKKDVVTAYNKGANSFVLKERGKTAMSSQFLKMFSYWDRIAALP